MTMQEFSDVLKKIASRQSKCIKLQTAITETLGQLAKTVSALYGEHLKETAFIEIQIEDQRVQREAQRLKEERESELQERQRAEEAEERRQQATRSHELALKTEERKSLRLKGWIKIGIVLAGTGGIIWGALSVILSKLD